MKFWTAICSLFSADADPEIIDHVPVRKSVAAKKIKRARDEALRRHGRTSFRCDEIKQRETPPSRTLEELRQASEPEQTNVSTIKRAKP